MAFATAFRDNRQPFIQAKPASPAGRLTIGQPNDKYEQEADAVADQVMKMPKSEGAIQRKCAECEEEEVQMKPLGSSISPIVQKQSDTANNVAPQKLSQSLSQSKGSGQSLPESTRSFMGSGIGANFSNVKVHTDNNAVQMNRQLNARAFTNGSDIYFNQGQYNTQSVEGKHLLAHELTHVVQQGNRDQGHIQRLGTAFGPAAGPSNWSTQVSAATTSAQKTALIQTIIGNSVTVNDATIASASDPVPNPSNLSPFSIARPVINFDENLVSKNARVGGRTLARNAGYTFQNRSTIYVVIADAALDGSRHNQTVQTINHEFDHVNQYLRNSTHTGNASELDAWTTSFIREFHHSYRFRPTDSGSTCYVELSPNYGGLSMYYQGISDTTQRTNVVNRITTYYNSTISSNTASTHAFRYWVYLAMRGTNNPDLGTALNTSLSLGIDRTASRNTYRAIDCSQVPASSLPGGSVISMPTAPSTRGSRKSQPTP